MSQEGQQPESSAVKKKTEKTADVKEGDLLSETYREAVREIINTSLRNTIYNEHTPEGKSEIKWGERQRYWIPRSTLPPWSFHTNSTEIPKIEEGISEKVSVNEEVIAKLTREIDELEKEAQTFESQRKRGEESLKEIARKLNMVTS
jgi:FAD/FMN-containing dehydrogenase